MTLKQKIQKELGETVKQREKLKVSVLRFLLAALLNKEKEKRLKIAREKEEGGEKFSEKELIEKSQLEDEEVIEVISSEIKKVKESILEFEKGGRKDLVEKEKKELEIFKRYLPKQLSEEEIKKIAREVIQKVEAKEIKDFGKVMAELMPRVKGRVEGDEVSKIVKSLLEFSND
ncbi:MAG: glutamyl-tRNA amidotransferase [Candidatus Nealsonbacteria bacterium CG03_land_8_20_14_0_80_36_12]|uniref:Glutamyl-tRNA amidotransferase n=1 Tax=Candidatus Nealsonbacteria bacterium CG03_land_8_20_14_0_80_36_12 TaxID=1974701 RepID=A0A2M7BYU3_9BACT|nr:MAG: glutamyl-tRNA amidotransferase [Candidatus Nealsonbacteria bacterium CG03_land_8_20_14_0_80_36_12]